LNDRDDDAPEWAGPDPLAARGCLLGCAIGAAFWLGACALIARLVTGS
jgi:hypothetical protein